MYQKIFNYVIFILIIIIILRYFTPNKESMFYILNIYINYFIDKIKQLLGKIGLYKYVENFSFYGRTFPGISNFESKTPIFNNNYAKFFINSFNKINKHITLKEIELLYHFIESLVSTDIDSMFLTPSDTSKPQLFTLDEKNKITNIILNKLNSGIYRFDNLVFLNEPTYYINFCGKDIEPLFISVNCDHNFNNLFIYIEIAIRNDVKRDVEYLVINNIKLLINNTDTLINFTNDKDLYQDKNLMDDLYINYDNKIFEKTNFANDFYLDNVGKMDNIISNTYEPYNKNTDIINYNVEEYEL